MRSYPGIVFCISLFAGLFPVQGFAQDEVPQAQNPETPRSEETPVPAPAPAPVPPKAKVRPLPQGTAPSKVPGKRLVRKTKKKAMTDALHAKRGANELDAAIVGEAQVLPKNVLRARYILRSVSGEKGWDSAGKEQNVGASLSAVGHALALEYGITDRWVFQLIAPYTSSNELVMNANTFRQSKQYEKSYQTFVESVAPTLIRNGLCTDVANCRTAIDNGLALGTATPVELPSGELATVGANVPINRAIDSIILKSIEPQAGKTGLGDIQIGIGYNVYNSQRNVFTVGLGMRFPSGLFSNVADAYRAPGAGFLTTGILLRYDLRLTPVIFSLSHQVEYSLNKAKRTRSSLLEPGFLNGQDPTADNPDIPGAGDGIPNEMMIERKGLYHVGYARIAYALGQITKYMKPFAIYGYYNYSVDPEYHNQGHLYRKKEELYSASYAISVDGLALNPVIPASFQYKRDIAIGGRNALIAPDSHFFQLNGYYKF